MIADAVVIVADWLADGTHGVAALLASVPKDFGWPTPSTPTIYNETQHPEVARGQVPDTLPALIVTSDPQAFTSSAPSVRPYPGDVFVTLQVRYAIANGETDEGVVDTSVMLRAIRKSLGRLVTVGVAVPVQVRGAAALFVAYAVVAVVGAWVRPRVFEGTRVHAMLSLYGMSKPPVPVQASLSNMVQAANLLVHGVVLTNT
jgi:hypothetical protein